MSRYLLVLAMLLGRAYADDFAPVDPALLDPAVRAKARVVASSTAVDIDHYELPAQLAGLDMTVRGSDGTIERRTIVADPDDPDVVWIDGGAYKR